MPCFVPVRRVSARRLCFRPAPLPVLLAGSLAMLSACVTVNGTLKPDGSGTLETVYRMVPTSTETLERRRFTSPQVTLESLKINDDDTAVAKLSFDDPAKLSTVEMFRSVSITRHREGQEERLTVTVTNPPTKEIKDEGKPGPKITIALPGKVLEANRNATVAGSNVTWSFGLAEFVEQKTVDLTARYLVADQTAPRGTPPKAGEVDKAPAAEK